MKSFGHYEFEALKNRRADLLDLHSRRSLSRWEGAELDKIIREIGHPDDPQPVMPPTWGEGGAA